VIASVYEDEDVGDLSWIESPGALDEIESAR
jgi:hypothetical protein